MSLNLRLSAALVVVFILSILPLPDLIMGFRPPFILLLVLYIQFFLPQYFNITVLFLIGLCLDVLLSTVIGEHAFALLMTTWFAAGKIRRFMFFSMIQQMMLILTCCLIYQWIIFLVDAFLGYHQSPWMLAVPPLLGMMCWPWVRILVDSTLRRKVS